MHPGAVAVLVPMPVPMPVILPSPMPLQSRSSAALVVLLIRHGRVGLDRRRAIPLLSVQLLAVVAMATRLAIEAIEADNVLPWGDLVGSQGVSRRIVSEVCLVHELLVEATAVSMC